MHANTTSVQPLRAGSRSAFRVHCDVGPILVNRTAVYRMCRMIPPALAERGFDVTAGTLLARLRPGEADADSPLDRRLFSWSQRWLRTALAQPDVFLRRRRAAGVLPRLRFPARVRLFLDPLYVLFWHLPERAVVLVYDLTTLTDPDWHGAAVHRLYDTAFDELVRSRCHFVATSQNTADHLRVTFGVPSSRVTVLPLAAIAAAEAREAAAPAPEDPFLLFVGSLEPRKNVAGLIRAYAASELFARNGIRLRIIGTSTDTADATIALARRTPGVDLKGFVDQRELQGAYTRCLAFVYPSFSEGFGLPLLEAMGNGCVCLASVTGASPEVGGGAVTYVDPYSDADIAAGLQRIARLTPPERRQRSAAARERASRFTWDRFHDGLADVVDRCAAG